MGFDTAVNTAMDAIDEVRDTSTSQRCSIIEWEEMQDISHFGADLQTVPRMYCCLRYDGNEQALMNRIIKEQKAR